MLFLENVIKPDGLDGPIWKSKAYNETLDRSNDDSQGRGQPSRLVPLTSSFADIMRGMNEKKRWCIRRRRLQQR